MAVSAVAASAADANVVGESAVQAGLPQCRDLNAQTRPNDELLQDSALRIQRCRCLNRCLNLRRRAAFLRDFQAALAVEESGVPESAAEERSVTRIPLPEAAAEVGARLHKRLRASAAAGAGAGEQGLPSAPAGWLSRPAAVGGHG
jgi:hypothetical protein